MITNKFAWSDKYSVGIASIDEQHKEFFSIANDAIDLANQAEPVRNEIESIFERLMYYAFYHFKTEEELFCKFKYPQTKQHIGVHKLFQEKINKLSKTIWDDNADVGATLLETAQFSLLWLADHIKVTDMAYSDFLKNQGVR
jgi:hemerythrin